MISILTLNHSLMADGLVTQDVSTQFPSESEGEPPVWLWVAPLMATMLIPVVISRLGWEPTSDQQFAEGHRPTDWNMIVVLATQLIVGAILLGVGLRSYLRSLPFRVTWWAVPLGVLGIGIWIGTCELGWEQQCAASMGLEGWLGKRQALDPLANYPDAWSRALFLTLRFLKLVVLVPLAEELFLRGYLLRFLQDYDWWKVSMRQLAWHSLATAALYGVMTHGSEILAAAVWFAAVGWWVKWRDRFWDAVVIHAITNLLLGLYVLQYQQWQYW